MTSKFTFLLLFCLGVTGLSAQLNMDLVGHLQYNQESSDIWGYEAPDGTEYVIMGLINGTSIVSLEDPENPVEVAYIPGQGSTWRDIKTWKDFAYVTCDQGGTTEGVLVIDLKGLPDTVTYTHWNPNIVDIGGVLNTCHNLYIDENGMCYLAGCNLNQGGIMLVDVDTQPGTPMYVNSADPTYSHDVWAKNGTMYSAELYNGEFGVYDVSDPLDIIKLAVQGTEFDFTHNVWANDDASVLYTTDEKPNAPVGAYDITDLNNIEELDLFRPVQTLGEGVIPHNVHTWDDYLIISYYTDGCIIVDAQHPDNLIEVGYFDTHINNSTGFFGAWGAYPYFSSGLIAVSDINAGLYIFQPHYMRAAYLKGLVTDAQDNAVISDVEISLVTSNEALYETTKSNGTYKTGLATPGAYNIQFKKLGYITKTVPVTLVSDEYTTLDVQLEKAQKYTYTGKVIDKDTKEPIEGADIQVVGDAGSFEAKSSSTGEYSLVDLLQGEYEIVAQKWGYGAISATVDLNAAGIQSELEIEPLNYYLDEFNNNLGWTVTGDAVAGIWERTLNTIATGTGVDFANPNEDSDDVGTGCYVTGNGGGSVGFDDVDNGATILTSPAMDMTGYDYAEVILYRWFFNFFGDGNPNDIMTIELVSPDESELLAVIETRAVSHWLMSDVRSNNITLRDQMHLVITVTDENPGHVVEGGIDDVHIYPRKETLTSDANLIEAEIFPNPAQDQVQIELPNIAHQGWTFEVLTLAGNTVSNGSISGQISTIDLTNYTSGSYIIQVKDDTNQVLGNWPLQVVK